MKRMILIILIFAYSSAWAWHFDVRSYGATGDGETLDTVAIQSAIDACADDGGGEVLFPAGRYLSGSLRLKSHVTLNITPDATLLGSTSLADFTTRELLLAAGVENVGITGGGTIDGQGSAYWVPKPYLGEAWKGTAQFEYRALKRPRFLRFDDCRNVRVSHVLLTHSPSWTLHLARCTDVEVTDVKIRNPLHGPNTDGIDINACTDVSVSDCDIITGDDGIVLKSTQPGHDFLSSNISIRQCRVWSACSGFKIGTETHGHFDQVTVKDCHFYSDTTKTLDRTISGIAIESVDGAHLTNILVTDVTMEGVRTPIFIRLGHRGGKGNSLQVEPQVPGRIDGVVLRNVTAKRAMLASSITGILGHPVQNILLENLDLEYEGGGEASWADEPVPDEEVIGDYPESFMFGRLPAYGLYCRHVEQLQLRNVAMRSVKQDGRPISIFEDVHHLVLDGSTF
jgi:polygalacturonase